MVEEEDDDDQIQPLDFDAPILSVRRIAKAPRPARTGPVVPFTWEQTPGRPKPPPGPNPDNDEPVRKEDVVGSDSSDGSRNLPRGSGSFRKDPEIGGLMMDRFLAAAKAAATGPLCPRRRGRDGHFSVAYGPISRIFVLNPASAYIEPHGDLGPEEAEAEHLWEDVYRHKLCWSDTQSHDRSSSYYGESNFHRTPPYDDQRGSGTSNGVDIDDSSADEHCEYGGSSLNSEKDKERNDTDMSLSLLSPPLPSSPSDSWLHRTLPSVSSKTRPQCHCWVSKSSIRHEMI